MHLPDLTEGKILEWADRWNEEYEKYPTKLSGDIPWEKGESWGNINGSLYYMRRGLTRKISLTNLLAETGRKRNPKKLPPLTEKQILGWVEKYFGAHKKYPGKKSGEIPNSGGESWSMVDSALANQSRELPRKTTLAKLIAERRNN